MSNFAIFRVHDPEKMEAALAEALPDRYLKVHDGEYIVSTSGTAKNLSDMLGISVGKVGPAIIFKMETYYGRAPTDVWEWVKNEAEKVYT